MSTQFECVKPLFLADSYKISHIHQYAAIGNITRVYSNYTHRKSRVEGVDRVVHFGLQAAIQRYLMEEWAPFFTADVDQVCAAYEARLFQVLGPNTVGSDHVRALHGLGHLLLKVCALPEGTRVPIGVPSWTIENTDPDFAWVTNYVETVLSSATWLACTSATTSAEYRRTLTDAAHKTGAPMAAVDWQAHDFSFRGMSSPESAAVSGAAHLLSFNGSDSLCTMDWIERYYGGSYTCGSVTATEHSIMSAGITKHGELETYRRLLEAFPSGILSIVSDTYDLWNVLTNILPVLKNQILARDGATIIRPDSGSPELILCGDPNAPMNSPAWWGVVRLLHQTFGATKNAKGYFELNPKIGAIYGDSITLERAKRITKTLKKLGYASTNVVFGVGSYCVAPDTPILCADLVWREAKDLVVGQEILAFDEDPTFENNRRVARQYRTATIEMNLPAEKMCTKIQTDIGDPVIASDDHPWLVYSANRSSKRVFTSTQPSKSSPRTAGLEWKRTNELKVGDQIAFLSKPWKRDSDYEAGWLAGIFDGEGCVSKATGSGVTRIPHYKINISQNQGPTLEKIRTALEKRGFDLYEVKRKCAQLVVRGGWAETLRFLGQIAPSRLMLKLPEILRELPGLFCDKTYRLATITDIASVGAHPVASIRTSCGTFITSGYLSHNTFQYVTRDTYGSAIKATWTVIDGQPVNLKKDPVTDDGTKRSATGRLAVFGIGDAMALVQEATPEQEAASLLQPIWADGEFIRRDTFDTIVSRVRGL